MSESADARRLREILAAAKPLAAEYYQRTGKPLSVTGEVAEEYVAAETLGLELAPPRTPGHDAIRQTHQGPQRIQIKGRAYGEDAKPGQRLGNIKRGAACDAVLLVLLDNRTLEPRETWEASYTEVEKRLAVPGSKARDRGALRVNGYGQVGKFYPNEGGNRLSPRNRPICGVFWRRSIHPPLTTSAGCGRAIWQSRAFARFRQHFIKVDGMFA